MEPLINHAAEIVKSDNYLYELLNEVVFVSGAITELEAIKTTFI